MFHAAVGEVAVDFVGDDDEIVLFGEGGDFLKVILRHDGACRVVWVADQKRLRSLRHVRLKFFGCDAEVVFELCGDGHGLAARKGHAGLVGDVARLGNQDFIAGREYGAHGDVERLADADGDEDVFCRFIGNAVAARVVRGNFFTQFEHAAVCRVGGVALLKPVDTAFADRPRRDEVRFADAQGYDVLHLGGDVEVFSYA